METNFDLFSFFYRKVAGKTIASLGPSKSMDDLCLHEDNFRDVPLGYKVKNSLISFNIFTSLMPYISCYSCIVILAVCLETGVNIHPLTTFYLNPLAKNYHTAFYLTKLSIIADKISECISDSVVTEIWRKCL